MTTDSQAIWQHFVDRELRRHIARTFVECARITEQQWFNWLASRGTSPSQPSASAPDAQAE